MSKHHRDDDYVANPGIRPNKKRKTRNNTPNYTDEIPDERPDEIRPVIRDTCDYQVESRCAMCSLEKKDGLTLDKDHIIPVRYECNYEKITGKDINGSQNMWTLCPNCHRKKTNIWDSKIKEYIDKWMRTEPMSVGEYITKLQNFIRTYRV